MWTRKLVFAVVLSASSAIGSLAESPAGRASLAMDSQTGLVRAGLSASGGSPRGVELPAMMFDGTPQQRFIPASPFLINARLYSNEQLQVELETKAGASAAITWTALDGQPHDFVVLVDDNSAYYGGGERFGSLNHKGQILPMASIDRPEDKGVISYKPVPFFMSTRGYGVWVDSSAPGWFDFNATERQHVRLCYRTNQLRVVLIDGPTPAAILDEFTRLTGRPRVPPAWSFAPWKSRNVHKNREEVLEDAELSRKHDLPGSVIVLDSPWETGYNNFILNERQFADPAAMFQRVAELGFYPCFWLTPFINTENVRDMEGVGPGPASNFAEAARQGFLVKRPDGEPMIAKWWKGEGGLVDFTNPAAVEWWQGQIAQIAPWGGRALKCDDGEGNFVQDAVFADGTPAAQMRSRYAALYLQAAQGYIDKHLAGDGVLLARCGFTGTQRYPVCWAGDNDASFSFENGLPTVILAGQNAALSGIPFWGHDIAGYMGTQDVELFCRWTQFGAFSPVMQVHMTSNKGPWDFGDEALAIYRTFAKLHTQLYPYLRDAAEEAARRGMPLIRPMMLAFPGDHRAAHERYQYMFGPDLLVAPMYQRGTHRAVYLPEQADGAAWVDFWTGTRHEGGSSLEVEAPLSRIPLWVREGAILCLLPDDIDTLIPRHAQMAQDVVPIDDRRILQVWPGAARSLQTVEGISASIARDDDEVVLTLSSAVPRPMRVCRALPAGGREEESTAPAPMVSGSTVRFLCEDVEVTAAAQEFRWR